MSLSRSSLHQHLREATRAPHRFLDHHPLLAPLVHPNLDRTQYSHALCALYGIHAPLEATITIFLERHPGLLEYAPRRKLPALRADIAELGLSPEACMMATGLQGRVLRSIPELIGTLYTLEGSTMGARVIANHLRAQEASQHFPLRFFSGYGAQTDSLWVEFLAWAEQHCPANQHETAAQAAVSLFGAIRDHLDKLALSYGTLMEH